VALDSKEKRASVVSTNPGAPSSVTPNAVHDQEWRQESGWCYSGVSIGAGFAIGDVIIADLAYYDVVLVDMLYYHVTVTDNAHFDVVVSDTLR